MYGEKLDGNYSKILRAILNKSWGHNPTKQQLHGHLPPIMKTIQVRRTRYAGHCWGSCDELISDIYLRTPSHGRAKAGRLSITFLQQLFAYTYSIKDIPEAMDDREGWRERVTEIRMEARYDDDDDEPSVEMQSAYSSTPAAGLISLVLLWLHSEYIF